MQVAFEKRTLANGLDVIVHTDRRVPLVAVSVWYHVGSKNERPGKTGYAHLFEHLMFEGSAHQPNSYFEPLQRAGGTLNGSTSIDRTNYWGQTAHADAQGRVLIPSLLRASADMRGEVAVIGHLEEYLEVWSLERLREPMTQPFPESAMDELGSLGI